MANPTLLMGHRRHAGDDEAEPILLDHEPDNVVVLRLDDGDELRLDRTELRAALDPAHRKAA